MHIPGDLNPADIATRALAKPQDVQQGSVWQNGPEFLHLPRTDWPLSRDFLYNVPDQELRSSKAVFNMLAVESQTGLLGDKLQSMVSEVMDRTNCLEKAVNVVARLCKGLFSSDTGRFKEPLTAVDIKVANKVLFIASMGPTRAALESGKLDSLRPVVRGGVIYARSRCDKSLLQLLGIESLPILMRDTRLAKLIMWQAHAENHRATSTDVLARSRHRAWIVHARYLAKEVCTSCPKCKLLRRQLSEQLMGDIPDHQLRPCPSFSYISIDFAGPYRAKAMGNSRTFIKLWGLVVICQNTRAVKMYATAGYSTDDFLTAYRRFTSNHGNPLLVVSDSGSQLKKAGQLISQGDPAGLDWTKIKEGAAKNGTDWKCVEPGCQWRNGLAESAVKLVKSTLELTLASQTTLNYAELDTLFSCIADTVNKRPIAVRSFTEEDIHAICPNDLLLGRSRNLVPGAAYDHNDSFPRRQQTILEIETMWWDQWIVQALPHLVPYKRWKIEKRNPQPKDIVLVLYDKKVGKGDYRLGRILRVFPDVHGVVRTVVVGMCARDRSKTSEYVPRPLDEYRLGVQRIAVICPVEEQTVEAVADVSDVVSETSP